MDASAVAKLRADGYEVVEQFYEPGGLGPALRDFDAVIIRSATKIKEPQINAARGGNLKLIIRAGVGMDNIAIPYAEAAGIAVRNTPRASSNAVAELALALLFSCARNISVAGHTMRESRWEKKAYSKGFELSGKTAGVIGYGRIGQLVGAKCQALGMRVLSTVHLHRPEGCECETMKFVPMDELLSTSDVLILCAPGPGGRGVPGEDEGRGGDCQRLPGEQRRRGGPAGRAEQRQGPCGGPGRMDEREGPQLGPGATPGGQLYAPHRGGHEGGAKAHWAGAGGHHRGLLREKQDPVPKGTGSRFCFTVIKTLAFFVAKEYNSL